MPEADLNTPSTCFIAARPSSVSRSASFLIVVRSASGRAGGFDRAQNRRKPAPRSCRCSKTPKIRIRKTPKPSRRYRNGAPAQRRFCERHFGDSVRNAGSLFTSINNARNHDDHVDHAGRTRRRPTNPTSPRRSKRESTDSCKRAGIRPASGSKAGETRQLIPAEKPDAPVRPGKTFTRSLTMRRRYRVRRRFNDGIDEFKPQRSSASASTANGISTIAASYAVQSQLQTD